MSKFFKVTEETFNDGYDLNIILGKLEQRPMEMIAGLIEEKMLELIGCVRDCESPIEMMLAIAMRDLNITDAGRYIGVDTVDVDNQSEITIGEVNFRVDFLIPVYFTRHGFGKFYVIECDGHEFHERTKEQVSKDNKRQRDLMNGGYIVIRFSGSEIFNDALGCAAEIRNIIINQAKELIRQCEGKSEGE